MIRITWALVVVGLGLVIGGFLTDNSNVLLILAIAVELAAIILVLASWARRAKEASTQTYDDDLTFAGEPAVGGDDDDDEEEADDDTFITDEEFAVGGRRKASSARRPAARSTRAPARKPAAKKPAARKPAARKPAAKKPAARKPAAAKKPAARKAKPKTQGSARPKSKPQRRRPSTTEE